MVRNLCVTSLAVRERLEQSKRPPTMARRPARSNTGLGQKRRLTAGTTHTAGGANGTGVSAEDDSLMDDESPSKRQRFESPEEVVPPAASQIQTQTPGPDKDRQSSSSGAAKQNGTGTGSVTGASVNGTAAASAPTSGRRERDIVPLFSAPPSAKSPLEPKHVLEAFAQIQRESASGRAGGSGLRNFRSGGAATRSRVALV
jgi:transcription initiation protein SPT3